MAKNILIVEDDIDTCEMLNDLLQSSGCIVQQARSLNEVKELLSHGYHPELVIADLQIPGCAYDGESIDTIRSLCMPNDVPIVLISATTGVKALGNMYNVSVLEKPFDIDALLEYTIPKIS